MTPEEVAGTAVPQLEGWVLLTDAAKQLSISRQRIHILKKRFKTLRRLGEEGSKPIYVVSKAELTHMKTVGRKGYTYSDTPIA